MESHQVLEPSRSAVRCDLQEIEQVELGGGADGAGDSLCVRSDEKAMIERFQRLKPGLDGHVGHADVFAQGVDGEKGTHAIG